MNEMTAETKKCIHIYGSQSLCMYAQYHNFLLLFVYVGACVRVWASDNKESISYLHCCMYNCFPCI